MRPSRPLAPRPHRLALVSLVVLAVLATPGAASAQTPGEYTRPQWVVDKPRVDPLDELGQNAYLTYYGLTRGAIHGALVAVALPRSGSSLAKGAIVLGAVGETVGAYAVAASDGMTPGKAHLLGTGLDFGIIAGAGVGLAAGLKFDWDHPEDSRLLFTLPLALSFAGATASVLLVDPSNLTWGDMEFVHMTGLVGGLLGTGAAAENEQLGGIGLLAGSTLGLLLGSQLISERDFSLGQSLLLDAGAVAGAIGGGIVAASTDGEARWVALSSGLGAAVGLGVTYLLVRPFAQAQEQKPAVELSLQVVPGSLMTRDTQTGRPAPTSLLLQGRF